MQVLGRREQNERCYAWIIMMVRAQIAMDEQLKRRATERASESGISFAEYVVKLVERDVERPKSKTGIEAIFDLGSSGGSDIARNKKQMSGDAIVARLKKKRRVLGARPA